MNLKPLGDRLAVKYVETEEKTESGIVLPDTAKEEKPQQGEVVAIGKGCYDEEDIEISKGDMVVFDKFSGTQVNVDGEDFIIVSLEDVLAVLG